MYTIGQVSEMFKLPISTLRYYDKEGLFPGMERQSGIRKFSERELEALRVIECLKKSGLEIKEKDLLILRYVLTGFSAKSIAALLGETHLNVNQRKKRLLDRIQIQNPDLFNELHNILNINKVGL